MAATATRVVKSGKAAARKAPRRTAVSDTHVRLWRTAILVSLFVLLASVSLVLFFSHAIHKELDFITAPATAAGLFTPSPAPQQHLINASREHLQDLRSGLTTTALVAIFSAFVLGYAIINRLRHNVHRLHKRQTRLSSENAVLEQRVKDRTIALEAARAHAEKERQRVETLLQDASHRIGNSLATVSSLLGLQLQRSRNPQVRTALSSARDRIQTIAAAHRRLRLGADMETASAGEFFNAVVRDVQAGLPAASRERIRFRTFFEPWHLAARDVTTLGIILGELLTNAVKHAFPKNKNGVITVAFGKMDEDILQLLVEDSGIGCTGFAENTPSEDQGLGQIVISQLSMQFGGKPRFEKAERRGGTRVIIPLPALNANKISN
ncbi:MAG: Two component system sensor histidine kinase [Candidatus Tokpelaia hoelldobleri]|uniref:histidine kinase n=1 Tax=Candidatus Tokpelaia hoelldobleri TaxID=1902579 RepID=A0A1U9JWI2_9HYPH|nr:MAG: Two component system sensor histidine kinase [Candidatus Tokpelaia hoelldoblerii]